MDENMKIINTIIPNAKTELSLLANHLHKLSIYERDKWDAPQILDTVSVRGSL